MLLIAQGIHPCYSKDMSKVTSKLQLTLPKVIADEYGIRPGDELQWTAAGESIRVELLRSRDKSEALSLSERIELFDHGTERLSRFQTKRSKMSRREASKTRGWRREELYNRGFPR